MYIIALTALISILDKGVLVTHKHPSVPPTLGRTSTLQSTSTPMAYLQRTPTLQIHPILLNKPLSAIFWRIGRFQSVWRFTQVYDIVNKSVYQVYSKFRIQNSEFRIQSCELSLKWKSDRAIWAKFIQNLEFGIQNLELLVTLEI